MSDTRLLDFSPTKNMLDFVIYENNDYIVAKHNRFICKVLDKVGKREIDRLILTVPPQYGKSHLVSRFSGKYFMENPDHSILYLSYSDKLVNKASRAAQAAVSKAGHLFGVSISKKKAAANVWQLEGHANGVYNACPLLGQITGETGHLVIIDDPLKNHVEAFSKTIKDRVWDVWDSTISTRLAPNAIVVIIMTRWSKDDLAGRMIKKDPNSWVVVNLPVMAEENDILGREPGDPLWEWKHTREKLKKRKSETSKYFWDSLWQGSPSTLDGEFKSEWLNYYKEGVDYFPGKSYRGEKIIKTISAKDPASGKKKGSGCYPVIMTADITEKKKIIIRHVWRERVPIPDQIEKIIQINNQFTSSHFLIEEVAMQVVYSQILNRTSHMIPFWPVMPHGNKYLRISAISPHFKNGRIIISEYMRSLIDEYLDFPNGNYVDILDTLEMIVSYVVNHMKDFMFDFNQIIDMNVIKKDPFMEF